MVVTNAPKQIYIAGKWINGEGKPFPSINPANGEEIATICAASEHDLQSAIEGAKRALAAPEWKGLLPHQRARILHKIGELIDSNAENLAQVQMRDNGKTIKECRSMISDAANCFRYYAGWCDKLCNIASY